MTGAAPNVNPVARPEPTIAQLKALIAEGDGVAITRLTLEMMRESEEWVELGVQYSEKAAPKVRFGWLREAKAWNAELGDELAGRWPPSKEIGEIAKRGEAITAELGAAIAKQSEPEKLKAEAAAWVVDPSGWPEAPLPPPDAAGLELLLYPRGLLGHVTQYIFDTALVPNRVMALAGALAICAKALDRKVISPLQAGTTLLWIVVLAVSGGGKNHLSTA
jgi:hypothetical protein